jgi:hypothetical protein
VQFLAFPFALVFMTVSPPEQSRVDDSAAARQSVLPRSGFLLGFDIAPGTVLVPRGFVPVLRTRHALGGGITDRFTLAAEIGGTFHLGIDKGGSFDADIVGTGFVGRGFALRAGLGVSSRSLARTEQLFRPAAGGLAGLGYEFALFSHGALRLGIDYDLRLRTDGRPVQAIFLGLGFRLYPRKR